MRLSGIMRVGDVQLISFLASMTLFFGMEGAANQGFMQNKSESRKADVTLAIKCLRVGIT